MNEIFDLDTPIEDVAKSLATVYTDVTFASFPIFRWLHVLNDATILAEEVRRNRIDEGIKRVGKILMRLLEFIGYFLYIHKTPPEKEETPGKQRLSDLVARVLQTTSYSDLFCDKKKKLKEGPTRWILAKYPFVCAKCGHKPCHCMIEPWVFEERREKPAPFEDYRIKVQKLRKDLKKQKPINMFSLRTLIEFFSGIYRNAHYFQEPWKLVMHLTEELGEATIELSRLELILLASSEENYQFPTEKVIKQSEEKLGKAIDRIIDDPDDKRTKKEIERRAGTKLKKLIQDIKDPERRWDFLAKHVVGEHLKEEIADVFSWISAVIYVLTKRENKNLIKELNLLKDEYVISTGDTRLKCPHCHNKECSNDCVVSHAIANELIEKAFHQ